MNMSDDLQSPATAADREFSTREQILFLNKKMTQVAALSSFTSLGLILLLIMMFPLKKAVPYLVQLNEATGEVTVPQNKVVANYNPSGKTKGFFLRRWVEDLFTINQYTTVNITDPRAQAFIRGKNGIDEYHQFRAQDQTLERLAADQTLVRDVKVDQLTAIAGTSNGALAQVTLVTHEGGQSRTTHLIVTLYFDMIPPTDPAEQDQNPIGIYVTDFKVGGASNSTPGG
jgi:type IV secretory pathway component VirB8